MLFDDTLRSNQVDRESGRAILVPCDQPVAPGFGPLMADFEFEDTEVSDALTYADQTVGRHGKRMTVQDRIAEAIARHGPDSPNAQARVDREPYILAVADRVERRLAALKRK